MTAKAANIIMIVSTQTHISNVYTKYNKKKKVHYTYMQGVSARETSFTANKT